MVEQNGQLDAPGVGVRALDGGAAFGIQLGSTKTMHQFIGGVARHFLHVTRNRTDIQSAADIHVGLDAQEHFAGNRQQW